MTEHFDYNGKRFYLESVPEPSGMPLYQFLPASNPRAAATRDAIAQGKPSVGYPDIIPLADGVQRVQLTKEWQLYIAAINPNMEKRHVAGLLGNAVAFCNGTGFGDEPRQNWLTGEDLRSSLLPSFDKVRTCSYACHTGRIEGSELVLSILDGSAPPPSISQINPKSHPHLFFHATIVWMDSNGTELGRKPFVNKRAVAPEWGYNFEVTLMPLVSCVGIRVPLSRVQPVTGYQLPYYRYP